MNILDKVIAYFNPERAARRAYFRSSLERGYENLIVTLLKVSFLRYYGI